MSRLQTPPSISPAASAALEGCLVTMILSPSVWVFVEFAFLALVVFGLVLRLGMHPVIGIVAGIATMIGLHVWLRARWAGVLLLSILTAFWSVVGGGLGWLLSPKSRTQLEWLRGRRLLSDEDCERRLVSALPSSDPLWDAFFAILGALLLGGLAYVIHRSVRSARLSESVPSAELPLET